MRNHSLLLSPDNPQAQAVCGLFEKYFSGRPPNFRDELSFLRRGSFELDWSAADGGVALASLFVEGRPASMIVLTSGLDPAVDRMMLETFRENVVLPLLGTDYEPVLECCGQPMLVEVIFPGHGEWVPALQLLAASLASVYFRGVIRCCELGGG